MDAPLRSPDLMRIRQAQLLTALIACTEGLCEINVTRNTVLGAHTPDERREPGALPASGIFHFPEKSFGFYRLFRDSRV